MKDLIDIMTKIIETFVVPKTYRLIHFLCWKRTPPPQLREHSLHSLQSFQRGYGRGLGLRVVVVVVVVLVVVVGAIVVVVVVVVEGVVVVALVVVGGTGA